VTRIALIPAFEPDGHLLNLLQALQKADFTLVVVDDGSGESYRSLFAQAAQTATVLTHKTNRGKGRALKTGFSHIQAHFPVDTVVVTLDADGQHSVPDAVRCAQAAEQAPDRLILGYRTFGNGVPLRSRFGNAVTRVIYRCSTGTAVRDTQTGLRAFPVSLIPLLLSIEGERYEYEMNVLLACPKQHLSIQEVEIATIYEDGNLCSHFHTFRDSFLIYKEILKFAGSSFACFLLDYGLYSLLVLITAPWGNVSIPFSNVMARTVSAGVNFTLNRSLVFHNHDNIIRTSAQYFFLVICILCGNTFFINWLVNGLGANKFAAKLVTELTFFTLSWFFQKFFIFRKQKARS
jgi:glycosyltransferase involved in cell wall biosynthesis